MSEAHRPTELDTARLQRLRIELDSHLDQVFELDQQLQGQRFRTRSSVEARAATLRRLIAVAQAAVDVSEEIAKATERSEGGSRSPDPSG